MKTHIAKMKADQKVLALEIRKLKSLRKDKAHNNGIGLVNGLYSAQEKYRIYHIAYCMLRGRTIEQIEPKLREPNSYTHTWVRKAALKIVADVLNPKPPEPVVEEPTVVQPVEVKKEETLWNKVTSFLSNR